MQHFNGNKVKITLFLACFPKKLMGYMPATYKNKFFYRLLSKIFPTKSLFGCSYCAFLNNRMQKYPLFCLFWLFCAYVHNILGLING